MRFVLVAVALSVVGAVGAALGAAGCAGPGEFVWYHEVPHEAAVPDTDYLIHVGDVLNIRVLNHDEMLTRVKVRTDGRIGVPILGEIEARGKRPASLRSELEARLKDYIVAASITLNVEEAQPMVISVLGEVARPGSYNVDPHTGIATALALSGGVTEFASRDRIFIVRAVPKPMRIRFTYEAVSRGDRGAGTFALHSGDLVVVE